MKGEKWRALGIARNCRKFFGIAGSLFLGLALLALMDGLIAQMRMGANELELLPGHALALSGPAALKNPLASDVICAFTPAGAPLSFELEGFFTGYWFGSGMWRGKVIANADAQEGMYGMRVAFRGASASTAQKWQIRIYADAARMQAASHSLIRRYFGFSPFILAAICGSLGILAGIATYMAGRFYFLGLQYLGFSEVYRTNPADGSIWCLAPATLVPPAGGKVGLFNAAGGFLGQARYCEWHKGKMRLLAPPGVQAAEGMLIGLKPEAGDDYR